MANLLLIFLLAWLGWITLVAGFPQDSATIIANPILGSGTAIRVSFKPSSTTLDITATSSPSRTPSSFPSSTALILTGPAGTSVIIHGTPVVAGLPAAVISGTTYSLAPSGTALIINGTPTPINAGLPATKSSPTPSASGTGTAASTSSAKGHTSPPTPSHQSHSRDNISSTTPTGSTSTPSSSIAEHSSPTTSPTTSAQQQQQHHHTPDTTTTTTTEHTASHPAASKKHSTPHSTGGSAASPASSGPSIPSTVAPGSFFKPTSHSGAAGLESPFIGLVMVMAMFGFLLMHV